jgi:acyl-coenzyme A synthetase/AMP-(fatty) acid ligase
MNIVEPIIRNALAVPEAPAFVGGTRTLSYMTLMRDVAAVSSRLAELGVRHGDVVAITPDGPRAHLLITLAVARIGAASVPFSHMAAQNMRFFAETCGVRAVVHDPADAAAVGESGISNCISLEDLSSKAPTTIVPMTRSHPDDLFRIAFSSGTTGRPKPLKFTHHNMAVRSHLLRTVFPSSPGERTMIGLPAWLHFSIGYLIRSLLSGGTLVDDGNSIGQAAEAIRTHKVTHLFTSPANAIGLVKFAQANPGYAAPAPDLQALCIGGARVAPPVQSLLRKHVCPNLYINYGMTEAGGLVAQADTALLESHPTSAGRLMPWVEMEAVDSAGKPLAFGKEGFLRVRTPTLANGYAGTDPENANAFRDGWFHSGDVGTVTGDGLVFLRGRADVLNLGGTKASAEEIESVIAEDPTILECAALTQADRLQQPRLVVLVVAPGGFDAKALERRCLNRFGPAFAPAAVIAVESLPHNAAGKMQREELAALAARHLQAPSAGGAAPRR